MGIILNLNIERKARGARELLAGAQLTIADGEKVALIGRNGMGKSTLFGLIEGSDDEYRGEVRVRKGARVIATRQEHAELGDVSVLDYVLAELPEYAKLHKVIETYPDTMGDDIEKIEEYTSALERFGELDFYDIEERVVRELEAYQLDEAKARGPLANLSGGQKRFVELVKVTESAADLALIDEPTNHMDYVGKAEFIKWLRSTQMTVIVISHDRDVLQAVDRIVELKDKRLQNFTGNYDAYLKQNTTSTTAGVAQYEVAQRTLENLHKQIQSVRARKASTSKTPNPFIPLERRLLKEYEAVKASAQKPSFWIDQESVAGLKPAMQASYDRYKERGLRLRARGGDDKRRLLVEVHGLELSYGDTSLFGAQAWRLHSGERLQLKGRNGAGKTSLIKALLARAAQPTGALALPDGLRRLAGTVATELKLIVGVYDQEVEERYLALPIGEAIEQVYRAVDKPINDQKIRQLLGDYLFDPSGDIDRPLAHMSGGQKARFQIIRMLAAEPNLLILDEPTNHLDLPSIEELESALSQYQGAILYVSHDSYFVKNLGGEAVQIA